MRFLKYGLIFIIPALFIVGLQAGGWLTFGSLLFAFGVVPFVELLFKPSAANIDAAEAELRKRTRSYDAMLYLVLPVIYCCIVAYLVALQGNSFVWWEKIGLTISLGIILGGLGINVAHELGHRNKRSEQLLALGLLLPAAYMHFYIEHNQGHHKNVSTHEDPASARRGETIYAFWIRSVIGSYRSAWSIESKRISRAGKNPFGVKSHMVQYTLIQLIFWAAIVLFFGWKSALWFTAAAIIGFLLLETVNYIEHYGLRRGKVSEHRYEKTLPIHSWNSNHHIGRTLLFELSRHSDHHFQPTKHYQILEHHDQSPQMPTGYPGMLLLCLVPPIWFAIMNPRLPNITNANYATDISGGLNRAMA